MDYNVLRTYSFSDLKTLANEMDIDETQYKDKQTVIKKIIECFQEYETYKKNKKEKFTKVNQIGNKGKEGVTYLVIENESKKEYAMKTFSKRKSSKRIEIEGELQHIASQANIAPKVIDVDFLEQNYIVMEKMDEHLYDRLINKQNGILTKKQQNDIIEIFRKLDEVGVFHGDSNILNYMYRGKKLYIIDFGMAKKIDASLIKKLGMSNPNYYFMTLGFIIKLKELRFPPESYKYLLQHVSDSDKEKFGLN